jgi:cysteinyl-tRNA synthetase
MPTVVKRVIGIWLATAVAISLWLAWDWRGELGTPARIARADAMVATLDVSATPRPASERAARLAEAESWGYQLQAADVEQLAASPYEVLVIDYSRNGSHEGAFRRRDIERIRAGASHSRRIVLSYMSIGRAESTRWYWRPDWAREAPPWLGSVSRRSSYHARFWHPDWQRIILDPQTGYLARILAAGFEGVFLDGVDAYSQLASERATARADMVAFVMRIAAVARARDPGFLVVPQNGEELLADPAYRATIDGIGKEDLLFGAHRHRRLNQVEEIVASSGHLLGVRRDGKAVLAIEYITNPLHIGLAADLLLKRGFVPHFAGRRLDELALHRAPREMFPVETRKRRRPWLLTGAPQS